MKRIIVVFLLVLVGRAWSQAPAPQKPDSSKWGWKHSVVSGLTLTQVSFKDWAQGGEDALAWTMRLDGLSKLEDTSYVWGNTYKMSYGEAKLGSASMRKTEDRLEFESVFTYKLGTEVNPYVSATLIRAGQPLYENSLRRPIAVHPGDQVTVLVKNGAVTVRAQLQAQTQAAVGDSATMINPASGMPVAVIVTGPRIAELVMQ